MGEAQSVSLMADVLTSDQRATLRAFCDTIVPPIDCADDPTGFWARRATDTGVDQYVEGYLATLAADRRADLTMVLDGLAMQDFASAPSDLSREQILTEMNQSSSQAALALEALRSLILLFYYGITDPLTGQNPNWTQLAYPGPLRPPPMTPKELSTIVPNEDLEAQADACVIGSGAGGAVIAAELARRGLSVVVLEAGGYHNEADFAQLELKAYQDLYWRGGPTLSADGNIMLLAGATLGGGTVVNFTNCVRTPDRVRREWANDYHLDGVDGPEFDAHLDAVLARIGATDECSDLNPAQERLVEGCTRLGWKHKRAVRNTDPATYSPDTAGYLSFGDQSGSKRSADKTWLVDALQHGAAILTRTHAQRVLVQNGRAAGVEALYADPTTGKSASITIHAPRVVIAAGALESPALLLRSNIGGPAVGNYLRLHPLPVVTAVHAGDMKNWWGAPHAMICDEFANPDDGYGFLIEGANYAPALAGAATPWTSGRAHKERMADASRGVVTISVLRDRGYGRVAIDPAGEAVITYAITDDLDRKNYCKALDAQLRLGSVTGATAMFAGGAADLPHWRAGDDLEAFSARLHRAPVGPTGLRPFSAHQMGSCRMGPDPWTSVAKPSGELHDTPGVWIGDASAFPTALGVNPMVTIMALARRTATAMAASVHTVDGDAHPVAVC